ncbi:MAG: hypothetical protein LKI24_09400 [Acidipropionibacterium sp.]|nr:hypothetical protein [Acidipropionibacterium sp.]
MVLSQQTNLLSKVTALLVITAVVTTNEQVMAAMVVHVMAQPILCGGTAQVTGRAVMESLTAPMPGRWVYAQAASAGVLAAISAVS